MSAIALRKTNRLAVMSLVSALLTPAFAPAAVAAVVFGHAARAELRATEYAEAGDRLAAAALFVGYLGIAALGLSALVFVLFA